MCFLYHVSFSLYIWWVFLFASGDFVFIHLVSFSVCIWWFFLFFFASSEFFFLHLVSSLFNSGECFYSSFNWFFSIYRISSDSKLLHVSLSFLCILADFKCAVVWVVQIFFWSPIHSLFSRLFKNIPRTLFTIGTSVTFMFLSFLCLLVRSWYLSTN